MRFETFAFLAVLAALFARPAGAQTFSGSYFIVLSGTDQSLEANAPDAAKNTGRVQHWGYAGGNHQQWEINPHGDGFSVRCKASGKALDANAAEIGRNGTALQLYDWHGGPNQTWRFLHKGGGRYQIECKQGGRVLDADKPDSGKNGGKVQLWDNAGIESHRLWSVYKTTTIPPDVKNALAGLLEGRLREAVSNQKFEGQSEKQHEEKVLGNVVARWSEEFDWKVEIGGVNFNIGSVHAGLDTNANVVTLIVNFDSSGEVKAYGQYKVPRVAVASVSGKGRVNLTGQAIIRFSKDGNKVGWEGAATKLDGNLSDLNLNNDAVNIFRGDVESKFNEKFGERRGELLGKANDKLRSLAGEQPLPPWVGLVLAQLK